MKALSLGTRRSASGSKRAGSRLTRRTVLRGAGSLAIGLPWLEAMVPDARGQADGAAKRFMAVYQPGGTVRDRWLPNGSTTDFTLSSILSPLEPVKNDIVVVDGLDMASAVGEQHQAGIVALLTGTPQSGQRGQFAGGPSIDQVLAGSLSEGKQHKSLGLAVRWATGKSHGKLHPINSLTFADDPNFSPLSPRLDPVDVWVQIFGSIDPGDATATPAMLEGKRSMLDYLDKRYEKVSQLLSVRDRQKLEEHLTHIRALEQRLNSDDVMESSSCKVPERVDTSGYNPTSGLNSSDDGSIKDGSSDAAIPTVGQFFMDMLVMAMACDITAVATLQWSDTEAKHTFPWLNLSEHHHFYQHDGGFKPDECEQICKWYSQQHAYLIQKMSEVDMGGHSLLDESILFFGSELQEPPTHRKNAMPFLLAGRGGGLETGRFMRFGGDSHNNLLLSLLRLCGDNRETFGDPQFCSGPLAGIG